MVMFSNSSLWISMIWFLLVCVMEGHRELFRKNSTFSIFFPFGSYIVQIPNPFHRHFGFLFSTPLPVNVLFRFGFEWIGYILFSYVCMMMEDAPHHETINGKLKIFQSCKIFNMFYVF